MACFKGDSILIKYLVENGANINAVDKYAKLPFIYCTVKEKIEKK